MLLKGTPVAHVIQRTRVSLNREYPANRFINNDLSGIAETSVIVSNDLEIVLIGELGE
jgi:hypothetical protein